MIELEKSYGKQTEEKNTFVGRYLQAKCELDVNSHMLFALSQT